MPVPLFLTKFLFQMMCLAVFIRDIFQRVQQPLKIFSHLIKNNIIQLGIRIYILSYPTATISIP